MKSLVKASKLGFIQDDSKINSEETITINSKQYPKYLPNPVFIEEKDLLFKSYYAPEFDNFKQLFKAHTVKDDFYIVIPTNNTGPTISSSTTVSVVDDALHNNAFSADYQDEINEFYTKIKAGLTVLKGNALQTLQTEFDQLCRLMEECTKTPSIQNVNSLRECHAYLLQKYAYLLN